MLGFPPRAPAAPADAYAKQILHACKICLPVGRRAWTKPSSAKTALKNRKQKQFCFMQCNCQTLRKCQTQPRGDNLPGLRDCQIQPRGDNLPSGEDAPAQFAKPARLSNAAARRQTSPSGGDSLEQLPSHMGMSKWKCQTQLRGDNLPSGEDTCGVNVKPCGNAKCSCQAT